MKDGCIEVPTPSVQRRIYKRIAAQSPVEVVFHVGLEFLVI
jgi:hypothetical protein